MGQEPDSEISTRQQEGFQETSPSKSPGEKIDPPFSTKTQIDPFLGDVRESTAVHARAVTILVSSCCHSHVASVCSLSCFLPTKHPTSCLTLEEDMLESHPLDLLPQITLSNLRLDGMSIRCMDWDFMTKRRKEAQPM